jgi:Ca2+-binding RTX toxin-like protein
MSTTTTTRKMATVLAVGALFLLVGTGVAFAVTTLCEQAVCDGTPQRDLITGNASDNSISGRAKGDTINDTEGPDGDTIRGGKGNDKINVREGNNGANNKDFVNCGPGKDTVFMDDNDEAVSCERINPDV